MPGWYCCSISCWGWGPPCCSSSWWVWEWNWPEVGVVCEWIVVTLISDDDKGETKKMKSSPAGVRSVRVGQVYCKLPPDVKSIFGWLLIILVLAIWSTSRTYSFHVVLWLFLQDGVPKELDGQGLCKEGQVRRLQKFRRCIPRHWKSARSSFLQRKYWYRMLPHPP